MKKLLGVRLVRAAMVLGLVGLLAGCESDIETDGADRYFDQNPVVIEPAPVDTEVPMRLTPETETLHADGQSLMLGIKGGQPPYRWTMADHSKGRFTAVASKTAVYVREDSGDNIVICTDSLGQKVIALIVQP